MARILSFSLLFAAALTPGFARATATWCVHDSTELRQALADAATSPEDDDIRVREGVYVDDGAFAYISRNAASLSISGGWYSDGSGDCAQMRVDASRTVIDGGGVRQALRIYHMPPAGATQTASLSVANLSLRNGFGDPATFQRGGGIGMSSYSDAYTEFRLENLIVANNDGYFGGGADLYMKNGAVRIANSLFDANRASTTASAQASITVNATAENVAHAVVIANSTFVRGRCAGNGGRGCGVRAGLAGGVHMDVVNSLFFDNEISDLNLEGASVVGLGDGSVSAGYSLVGVTGGNLPLNPNHALQGDPRFVDALNGDFRLRDDSPFINQGLAATPNAPVSVLDLDAHLRTQFGAADPGAYENQTWDFLFADGFER